MENVKRNTAYKVWIADLISSQYFRGQEQFEAGYAELKGSKVSRINVLGSIVDKYVKENSISFSLDDGSGILKLRTWNDGTNLFHDVEIGDMVVVIGKVKEYNNSIYVTPEVIKKLDNPLWLKVRKLELVKKYGEVKRIEQVNENNLENASGDEEMMFSVVEEKVGNSDFANSRELVLGLIDKLDFGDGADVEEVVTKSGFTGSKELIDELLKDGEIFELHKGKVRVMG